MAALTLLAASAAMAGMPPRYHIEKIKRDETGLLKANLAQSINNDGVVVGWSRVDNFGYAPFMLDGRRPQQMQGPAANSMSGGHAINIRREVVGSSYPNAYLWDSAGTQVNLSPLVPCTGTTKSSDGIAINDTSVAVGNYSCLVNRKMTYGAWLYQDGHMTDLGTLGGAGNSVHGINNIGQVVGGSGVLVNGKAFTHAYLWQDGAMQDLGTLGEENSEALAINDAGRIVGRAYSAFNQTKTFGYKDGVMYEMPKCAGNTFTPSAINNHGQVVGNFRVRFSQTAVLVQQNQCYFLSALLDDSGEDWRDLFIYDINDEGVIVGDSNKGAFIATPLK